jgi:hypothetical protein
MEQKKDLINPQGFMRAYFENLKNHTTSRLAYEQTEAQYMKHHNTSVRKYTSFESFCKVKNRMMTAHQI